MKDDINRDQVDRNYEAFLALPPEVKLQYGNKYALMHDGEVLGYFSTLEDAYMAAKKFLKDKPYSVQKVTDAPVDLGFFSHVMHLR